MIRYFLTIIQVNCAGQTREAEKIVMHENYNTGGAFANDIALIKLDEPFWINNVRKLLLILRPYIFFLDGALYVSSASRLDTRK